MSHEYQRRGRNWFTAIGLMFCVMATIVLIQQLLIWGPDFVEDFLFNAENCETIGFLFEDSQAFLKRLVNLYQQGKITEEIPSRVMFTEP